MEKIEQIIFYSLEKSIKTYRQFAQKNISKLDIKITLDQWLILKSLEETPGISQQQIAVKFFKDYASVTRIIEILVKKKYLSRKLHSNDRRRFDLGITKLGLGILSDLKPIIHSNRAMALNNISKKEIETLQNILTKITKNCV